jgi:predicted enzyme related to lactoylglutathione lyase
MIKFAYTILYVEDVLKSMDFYQRAFGFKEKSEVSRRVKIE